MAVDYLHIDAATIFLTTDPARFDVIVTDNLFGDIITDLAAAITGGIGLAASATSTPTAPRPDVRAGARSAPDIAGQQKADPTAAILSAALLLDHLGSPTRPPRSSGRSSTTSPSECPARAGVPPRSATRSRPA